MSAVTRRPNLTVEIAADVCQRCLYMGATCNYCRHLQHLRDTGGETRVYDAVECESFRISYIAGFLDGRHSGPFDTDYVSLELPLAVKNSDIFRVAYSLGFAKGAEDVATEH